MLPVVALREDRSVLSYCSHDRSSVVRLFLLDPRIDPTYLDNGALSLSVQFRAQRVEQLLLWDDRVIKHNRQNSNWKHLK